jgi:hypothetical protein
MKIKTWGIPATLKAIGVAAVLAASGTYVNAATYDFSYTWGNGDHISGSFTGTGPLSDVTDISGISASFNGTPLGALSNNSYTAPGTDCSSCFAPGGAMASSNALNNNFEFASATAYFYMIPWPNSSPPGNTEAVQFYNSVSGYYAGGTDYNGNLIPANWSLTAVPLPSTWLMLLGGLAGLGLLAYRIPRKSVATTATA